MSTELGYEFKIAGFAKRKCKRCYGTGRIGFEQGGSGRVQPCHCLVYFQHDDIVKAHDEAKATASGENAASTLVDIAKEMEHVAAER